MKSPDREITLTFFSVPTQQDAEAWRVRLTFPPCATDTTLLSLEVLNGDGSMVTKGVFELAGQQLQVKDGEASICYADFVAGIHEKGVWLLRPGHAPLPGGLTFT